MPQTYFAILTAVGEAKDANAKALGVPLVFTEMSVGDGNGNLPVPDRTRVALVNEVRRAPINQLSRDPVNTNQVIAEQVIPENVGGWWIREIGLHDEDGDLIAIANCPPTYKPQLVEGSGRTQVVRMVLIMSSADAVQLKIDPAVVLATRAYADTAIGAAIASVSPLQSSRDFPDGTLIKTSIPYGVASDVPFFLEIKGNAYQTSIPFDIKVQGYIYNNGMVYHSGISNGATIAGLVAINVDGNLCFWFPNQGYWQGFTVSCNRVGYDAVGVERNLVVSITATAKPAGATKEVAIGLVQSWHSGNFNPDLFAPKASPNFTGAPTAPTPAQFDNDLSLSTTAFVQRALGNMRGSAVLNADTDMDATHLGKVVRISAAANGACKLPDPTISDGAAVIVYNSSLYEISIGTPSGTIETPTQDATPFLVRKGEVAHFVSTGVNWRMVGGTSLIRRSSLFPCSLNSSNTWQQLPSGLIIQMGVAGAAANSTTLVTCPVAFPTAFIGGIAQPRDDVAGATGNPFSTILPSGLTHFSLRSYYTASGIQNTFILFGF